MTQEIQTESNEMVVANRAMVIAEIESQIATAKRYPRDIKVFKEKTMSMANLDQETAEGCYYALPRGGKTIDGPSVRLAEIALACYGNCVAEADVLTEDDRFIYAMGQCRDLENNVAVRVKVRRRITDKNGKRYNDDMIAVTANAACSIALRNAVFKVIPGAFIKPVFHRVKQTAVGKATSLANRRAEVITRLTKFGIAEDRILAVIDRKSIDEVTFDDVAKLIGLGTAIKDGEITVEEAFPLSYEESQKETQEKIHNETGSKDTNVNFGNNPQKPAEEKPKQTRGRKKNKGDEKTEQKQDVKQENTAPVPGADSEEKLYRCQCGHEFDKPKPSGSGARQVAVCPKCFSKNIQSTEDLEAQNKPGFMKD